MESPALISSIFFFTFLLRTSLATTFTIKNNCPYTVWPGTLNGSGSAQLSSTGFQLSPGESFSLSTSAPWSGRFWGRTGCSTDASGRFSCATGDCASGAVACNGAGGNPPVSLAEFTLVTGGGQDNYDLSLVDGFNLPVSIVPQGGSNGCQTTTCAANVNSVCPAELAVKDQSGNVIACKSACEAFGSPQYCCTESYSTPQTCPPTNYSEIFKGQCPQAYSYAYDDANGSLYTCVSPSGYVITFCP
ncbi:hypothetical protein MLD38_019578 [Melastoma candidum]|uniref:Uncharacterized protein n=2 Tax=Melastoma candidum TaxID=119954 RepID=A0ACB9QY07_9MYRT|nr:hypothetical protein MLD38_019577 [Melastoma candidum]KAI4371330.1 hypothetical protein MLD38_019578 [Melastoma candidum]